MDKTIELVNAIKDIQAMPSVIVRVLNVMKKPTVSMKELGDIVMYDQSLTIKILALVNSAYYGFSQQISSISIALSLLGMVKVKNIIVAVAMKPMMSNSGDKDLWKHSIRVAAGCEYLAKLTKVMDSDEAFIAGLPFSFHPGFTYFSLTIGIILPPCLIRFQQCNVLQHLQCWDLLF